MRLHAKWMTVVALAALAVACSPSEAVPELTGEEQGYAQGVLVGAGFDVEIVEEEQAGVNPGQVLSQEPEAGIEVNPEETTVTLMVAVSPEYTLTGSFTLRDRGVGSDDNCRGEGGYDDIREGVEVVVKDGSGTVLAKGDLGRGDRSLSSCVFEFTVGGIPEADFYEVEVGSRGSLTYSFDELKGLGWDVGFELG